MNYVNQYIPSNLFSLMFLVAGSVAVLLTGCATGKKKSKTTKDFPDVSDRVSIPDRSDNWPKTHTVEKGENLWQISEEYYGTGKHWKVIYNQNVYKCENPNAISDGVELTIPKLSRAKEKSRKRARENGTGK